VVAVAFVSLPAQIRIRLANNDLTYTKAVLSIKNRSDSSALTDPRQMDFIPQMSHTAGEYGDKLYIEIKTSESGKDGVDAGTSTIQFPVRIQVKGTNYIENRMLEGVADFSMADISSGTLTNDSWITAWSYSIPAGESLKLGFQASFPNSRSYFNLSDDTGS
tara:strand:- start:357 stop:842 length:486 start_codon:yes stop_codon:yes gene_type:complete